MLQEQGDGHRHQVERRLVIGCEALLDLARRTKELRHAINGLPLQISESVVANVILVLVHNVVQNDMLANNVGSLLAKPAAAASM